MFLFFLSGLGSKLEDFSSGSGFLRRGGPAPHFDNYL